MNTTRTFCELIERWNYIAQWKAMGLSREPYGCVRLHDSACLLISENILHQILTALLSDVRGLFIQNNYIDHP